MAIPPVTKPVTGIRGDVSSFPQEKAQESELTVELAREILTLSEKAFRSNNQPMQNDSSKRSWTSWAIAGFLAGVSKIFDWELQEASEFFDEEVNELVQKEAEPQPRNQGYEQLTQAVEAYNVLIKELEGLPTTDQHEGLRTLQELVKVQRESLSQMLNVVLKGELQAKDSSGLSRTLIKVIQSEELQSIFKQKEKLVHDKVQMNNELAATKQRFDNQANTFKSSLEDELSLEVNNLDRGLAALRNRQQKHKEAQQVLQAQIADFRHKINAQKRNLKNNARALYDELADDRFSNNPRAGEILVRANKAIRLGYSFEILTSLDIDGKEEFEFQIAKLKDRSRTHDARECLALRRLTLQFLHTIINAN